MPVTFTCPKCNTLLRVSRKKIGETVGCPKCDTLMVVPEQLEEPAAAEAPPSAPETSAPGNTPAPSASSPGPTSGAKSPAASAAAAPQTAPSTLTDDGEEGEYDDEELISEFIVYDDSASHLPNVSEEAAKDQGAASNGAAPTPAAPATGVKDVAASTSLAPKPAEPDPKAGAKTAASEPAVAFDLPPGMVLVPRMALMVLTLIFLGAMVGSYSVGYLLGKGDAPPPVDPNETTGPGHSVVVEGRMTYITPQGNVAGDAGAILVALPQGATPDPKLPHVGLRPDDIAALGLSSEMSGMVRKAGGNVVQADVDGVFLFTVPKPGKYFLLGISRKANRAEGRAMRADDLAIFSRFFGNPEILVGKKKYLLKLENLERLGPGQVLSFGPADE